MRTLSTFVQLISNLVIKILSWEYLLLYVRVKMFCTGDASSQINCITKVLHSNPKMCLQGKFPPDNTCCCILYLQYVKSLCAHLCYCMLYICDFTPILSLKVYTIHSKPIISSFELIHICKHCVYVYIICIYIHMCMYTWSEASASRLSTFPADNTCSAPNTFSPAVNRTICTFYAARLKTTGLCILYNFHIGGG